MDNRQTHHRSKKRAEVVLWLFLCRFLLFKKENDKKAERHCKHGE